MSTQKLVEERYDDILKPDDDDISYRGLILANKMKVLLMSNSDVDISSVVMNVNVGYMSDPDDLPGLAHLCKHMSFMGTKKYPGHNDYKMYLSQNGGMANAMTHSDHTIYYLEVNARKLEGALDRFAQFFLAPLFTESATELELSIINSEHEKNLTDDSWRLDQLEKSSASPDHPYSKFGTGNRETLDVIPKQRGINVRNKLLEFHEKYYSANLMSLCVLGKESLDELEEMVVSFFSEVRNKEIETPIWPEHPFKDEHFGTIWYIVPLQDIRHLDITFPLPDIQQHYRSSPVRYVCHLLGHKGEGSLLSTLRAREWCNILTAENISVARALSFFRIKVDLTKEGIQHIKDIVQLLFQYINMLKSRDPVKWIYEEYKCLSQIKFDLAEYLSLSHYVNATVQALQKYPMNDVLRAEHVFPEWRPDLIKQIMEYLTPQNIRIRVIAKEYETKANETEKWYGTKYRKDKISKEIMDMWNSAGYNTDLKLPLKNEFIPDTFDNKIKRNPDNTPMILNDRPLIRLWYKRDEEFITPKARMIFNFVSPQSRSCLPNCNLTEMFVRLVCDSLYECTHAATVAGLEWELTNSKYGIKLDINGYDYKQHMLLKKIINRMANFKIDSKRFEIIKEQYIMELRNFAVQQPYEQANFYLEILLSQQVWLTDELLASVVNLDIEKLQSFIPELFSTMHVECLIHGNIVRREAIDIIDSVESELRAGMPHIEPLSQQVLYHDIKLQDGCHFLFEAENKLHSSSCTLVYYPIDYSRESYVLLELLAKIITEPCFNTLRTQEQLGYIVFCAVCRRNGALGLRIIIQSDKHPQYIEGRIESFLHGMFDYISNVSRDLFQKYKNNITVLFITEPNTLNAQCNIYWNEIVSRQYDFDVTYEKVEFLQTITKEELLKFCKENIHSENPRKLSIHVMSTAALTEKYLLRAPEKITNWSINKKIIKIDDIKSFKKKQNIYPVLKYR